MFTSIFSAYGVSPYLFIKDDDGGIVYGGITEQTRSALKTLNQWYKEGLIDPEFITADNRQINGKFVNKKIGYVDNLGWNGYYKASGYITKPALEKGIQVVAGTPLIGPAGKLYAFSSGSRQAPLMLGVQLEEDDKKRQKIEQILEWVSTDPEGWLLTTQGVEGVNYDMADGKAVARTGTEAHMNKTGAGSFYNPLAWINKDFYRQIQHQARRVGIRGENQPRLHPAERRSASSRSENQNAILVESSDDAGYLSDQSGHRRREYGFRF